MSCIWIKANQKLHAVARALNLMVLKEKMLNKSFYHFPILLLTVNLDVSQSTIKQISK